jgi:hypothetical protein
MSEQSGEEKTQRGQDKTLSGEDETLSGEDKTLSGEDETQSGQDKTRRRGANQIIVIGPSFNDKTISEGDQAGAEDEDIREAVEQPAKVMRIGSMIKQLLEEVRQAPLDAASRARLREIYDTSVHELSGVLSADLRDELSKMASPFGPGEIPSESELRVAQAQLVGWLEGLFHGIQATLFAQQMAARAQLEQMRQRGLPRPQAEPERPGTYL